LIKITSLSVIFLFKLLCNFNSKAIKTISKNQIFTLLESLHFPFWIVKDASWFAAIHFVLLKEPLQYISLIFAIPTITITGYLIYTAPNPLKRLENILLGLWLIANTSWMLTELYELPFAWLSKISFGIGLLLLAPFLLIFKRTAFKKH